MDVETPKGWRKGQTIFNFLEWLRLEHGYTSGYEKVGRMADPFHIPDSDFDSLYQEFFSKING